MSRWGQVFILDALSRYKAADAREAENIVERVTPRLQHANCAVVLSAVKVTSSAFNARHYIVIAIAFKFSSLWLLPPLVLAFFLPFLLQMILQQMELITSTDVVRNLCKKMAPPLVTLLSAEPEIQYVALRNINLIVQRRPTILAHEIKVNKFQCYCLIPSSTDSYEFKRFILISKFSLFCRYSFASTMILFM